MRVASLEPCKQLYELSGWDDYDSAADEDMRWYSKVVDEADVKVAPMYPLGYMLTKLPRKIAIEGAFISTGYLYVHAAVTGGWEAGYSDSGVYVVGAALEDAVCKLAIELFKQGILTRDES